jgi:AcrR family transcriptional regulator
MTVDPVEQPVRRRTGGRSARVRTAVLQAALETAAEHGLAGVTISEIARRAGVHATSIQRRWGSRDNVVLDAMLTYSRENLPIPDTGSLRDDLVAFARSLASYLDTPLGEAVARAMVATDDDPELAAGRARFWLSRYEIARVMVDRAIGRGELAAGTDPALTLELLIAPVHFRKLLSRQTVDDGFVVQLVDAMLGGLPRR